MQILSKHKIYLLLGVLLSFSTFLISYFVTSDKKLSITLAIAVLMFSWWIFESFPMPITALIPICTFPIFGIIDINEVSALYGNKIVFLMLSGFLLSLALKKWKLNYRIALNILKYTGNNSTGIILGFMIATAFLSMWISNTSATIIMLPIALAFLQTLQKDLNAKFAMVLILSIAYSASIGGIATIIGTPTNAILISFLDEIYNIELSFAWWFIRFFPLAIILIISLWIYLAFFKLRKDKTNLDFDKNFINKRLKDLGKLACEEKHILLIFFLLASSWVFKSYFPFEISDSAIGVILISLLFLIPTSDKKGKILEWKDTKDLSWGTLLVFGGALSLAKGLEASGAIHAISDDFLLMDIQHYLVAIIVITLVTIFLTEFMTNLALISVLAPVLMVLSFHFTGSAISLSIPATIAASCAFMLPMATPPNTIIFSSGYVKIKNMIKAGFLANLIASFIVITYCYFVI